MTEANSYRAVRLAGDELVHFGADGAARTIGCGPRVTVELSIAEMDATEARCRRP